jgi:hypothetical protein
MDNTYFEDQNILKYNRTPKGNAAAHAHTQIHYIDMLVLQKFVATAYAVRIMYDNIVMLHF